MIETKRCNKCDIVRTIDRFAKDSRCKGKYRNICKDCTNLTLQKQRRAKRDAARLTAKREQEARTSVSDIRMTEKEHQRRLRAVEAMW